MKILLFCILFIFSLIGASQDATEKNENIQTESIQISQFEYSENANSFIGIIPGHTNINLIVHHLETKKWVIEKLRSRSSVVFVRYIGQKKGVWIFGYKPQIKCTCEIKLIDTYLSVDAITEYRKNETFGWQSASQEESEFCFNKLKLDLK